MAYMDRVALNQNSNNNIPKRRVHVNVLPSKIQPKSGKLHTSGSGGSGYSVNPWDVSNSPMIGRGSDTTNIHSSSPQVPRKYSSSGLYHNGSHNYGQTGGQSGKTPSSTDGPKPPPYQPPNYASLGTCTQAHSGASTPRARRREDRSSRSTDKLDSKASGRSRSLSRDSSSKFTQESDRQSRDRVRSTHSKETITETEKVNKKSRPRSRSHSRDRLSTTAAPHTSDGGDMLSRDKNSSSTKSMQESDRKSRDRVRRTHSNETVTGAEKVDRKPRPRSRSQSRDTLSTSHASDGGGMQDKRSSSSKLGLAGHSSATVNSMSNDRPQNEGGARDTHSGVNVGKEGKERQTGNVGSNTPTRSQSDLHIHISSTPMQGEDVNTSQLGHQNSMSSERTNRMQNEGGAQSSGYSYLLPKSGGMVGISNLGNTCFMNSMLQCLGQTGEMTEIFLKNPGGKELVKAYSKLMQEMWKESGHTSLTYHALYPRTLKDIFSRINPQFSGYNQHDSQEFMRFLVSGLHEELKEQPEKKPEPPKDENDSAQWWKWYMKLERSALAKVFVGQLRSTLKCQKCHHESLTFDPFWELSVSMQKRAVSHTSRAPSSSTSMYSTSYSSTYYSTTYSSFSTQSHSNVHLEDCLDLFTNKEILDGDEKPFCTNCRSLRCCSKKMTIERLPKVLVIHLKRFSGYGYRSKLNTPVTIPHTLDLAKYCTDEKNGHAYELYALSHHTGSVYFGHYTAWCKHYSTGKWYSYNDSSVTPNTSSELTSRKEFPSSTAYVLFYRRKDSSLKFKSTSV